MERNWLVVMNSDGETVFESHSFDTYQQILDEIDQVWSDQDYQFDLGGPAVDQEMKRQRETKLEAI